MKLASKIGITFSLLFAIVLMLTAAMVYFTTKTAMTRSIENHLDNISDLIKRTVEISIDNNWGQVQKSLILSEQIIRSGVTIDHDTTTILQGFSDYDPGLLPVTVDTVRFDASIGERPEQVVWSLAEITDAEVSLYRVFEGGMIAVATSISDSERGTGHVLPRRAPVFQLIERNGTWIGRDYFSSTWYLTGYRAILVDGRMEAVLEIAIPQVNIDLLREDILSVEIGQGGFPYIIDSSMNVVIHPNRELERNNWSLEPFAREIAFNKNGHLRYEQEHGSYIATYKHVPVMNWIVVAASSIDDAYASIRLVGSFLIVIFGLATLASLITSVLVSRQVTKPVADITARFREIAEGEADLNRRISVVSNDEVGQLAEYFNRFIHRLRQLNEVEHREVALELRDAQINALQAQINPHFLYNTLETVRFMIEMQDERATLIVQHLADLFRISIGKGERYVTVEHELRHIQLYSWIHELRYPNRFSLVIEVPDSARKLYSLKFILQPIVENAIHHGLDQIEHPGRIEVSADYSAIGLLLRVKDNGRGIPEEQLRKIKRQLGDTPSSPNGSIGLKNVHERLRLHFGAQYGLDIANNENRGTTVSLRIPRLEKAPPDLLLDFTETNDLSGK